MKATRPTDQAVVLAIDTGELASFVNKVIADQAVIGVKAKDASDGRFVFDHIRSASQLRLDYDVTILPPKKYLLPPCETLVEFKLDDSPSAEACVPQFPPTVLIGVHPYDMIAINQLDRLMWEGDPDPNYFATS